MRVKHKPRNHGGEWIEIEEGEAVRVDSRRGKRMRVVLESTERLPDCVVLLDGGPGCPKADVLLREFVIPTDRSSSRIETTGSKVPILFLECVLRSQCDRHCLRVTLVSPEDSSVLLGQAETIHFKAHDSGWVYKPAGTRNKRSELAVAKWKLRSRSRSLLPSLAAHSSDPPLIGEQQLEAADRPDTIEPLCEDVLMFIRRIAEQPVPVALGDHDLDPCSIYTNL